MACSTWITVLLTAAAVPPVRRAAAQVWSPEAAADTSTHHNRHQHKLTPYADLPLKGRVLATFVRGHQVFDADAGVHEGACGSVVKRTWMDVKKDRAQKQQQQQRQGKKDEM
jgi:hypothetical protein